MKKKIVLLGDSAVGKTSLIRRFVFDQFEDSYIATIGSKVTMKDLSVDLPGRRVDLKLMIWDLIGREGYHALHSRTLVGVHGAILVADLTRKSTLDSLERYWIPFLFKVVEDVPMVFVSNKADLKDEYEFEPERMDELASRYSARGDKVPPCGIEPCHATSAKDGTNVEEAFTCLGHLVISSHRFHDPIKELYEGVVATGIRRTHDTSTPIGALDEVMIDFCEGFDDSRMAMIILRQEFARAGIDIDRPTVAGMMRGIEYLAEAEAEFKDEKVVRANLERRRGVVQGIDEKATKVRKS